MTWVKIGKSSEKIVKRLGKKRKSGNVQSFSPEPKKRYYLAKDGQQISKAHSTPEATAVEAYERKMVVSDSYGDYLWGAEIVSDNGSSDGSGCGE